MTWRPKEPGQQYPWYWSLNPEKYWFQHQIINSINANNNDWYKKKKKLYNDLCDVGNKIFILKKNMPIYLHGSLSK